MPEIKRRPDLENKKYPYVIEYKCVCGLNKPITYNSTGRPEKLIKCFKCDKVQALNYLS